MSKGRRRRFAFFALAIVFCASNARAGLMGNVGVFMGPTGGGSGGVPSNAIVTEAGVAITTESGATLVTEV